MNKPTAHRQSIDLARFLAAFGVVIAHAIATPRDWVGHLSLSLFLILTAFLAVQSAQRAGGRYPFLARAQKLVLPWLVWSAFFRLVDLVFSDDPGRFAVLHDPWSLLYGSSIHLWFLPFVMLAMGLVEPGVRWINTPQRVGFASLGLLLLTVPLFWAHDRLGLPEPLPQWAFALPAYVMGLLLGIAEPMGPTVARYPKFAALGMAGVGVAVSGGAPWVGTPLLAVAVFSILWDLPLKGRWLPPLGQVAFGIYLVHPFFMLVSYKLFGGDVNRMIAACTTFLMSWVAVMVMRKFAPLRRVT